MKRQYLYCHETCALQGHVKIRPELGVYHISCKGASTGPGSWFLVHHLYIEEHEPYAGALTSILFPDLQIYCKDIDTKDERPLTVAVN